MSFRIALLPGDGIGPEVTEAAVDIINLVAKRFNVDISFSTHDIGGSSYVKNGTPLVCSARSATKACSTSLASTSVC